MPHAPRARWLLLIHHLPKDPAYLRVKIGRRLARVGAVPLKSSVYVLPASEGAVEDLQWVRREIVAGGGEATVVEAELVEGLSDAEVEARFRAVKSAEYAALAAELRALPKLPPGRQRRPLTDAQRSSRLAELARIERRLEESAQLDFFDATGRELVLGLLRALRRAVEPESEAESPSPENARPRARTWVTRTGIAVDRIASAWLIRRFIDREARFAFVPAKGYVPEPGELRFDMFEAEYSHEGDHCTFETLLTRFELEGPGLRSIAEIVHDIDIKDDKFSRPETAGVAACIAGLCRTHTEDAARLELGSALFEALLAHFDARSTPVREVHP